MKTGLAQTLRLLANARGLTPAGIAAAIPRVGAETVSAWMRGEQAPAVGQVEDLARALGLPVDTLRATFAASPDPARSRGEDALLAAYRALDAGQQAALLDVARGMTAARGRTRQRTSTGAN